MSVSVWRLCYAIDVVCSVVITTHCAIGVLTEETKERYLKEVQSRLDDGPESESHHVQLESRLTDNP